MTKFVRLTLAILLPIVGHASELQYFDKKIDFWNENVKAKEIGASLMADRQEKETFPWKTYLDPKNREFFKEGDYTPPEPFMEVARNPSDDNIKNWFDFMQKKNDLADRLQVRMQEYLAKNGSLPAAAQLSVPTHQSMANTKSQPVPVEPGRFKIRMYFDSQCPHCRRMFQVLQRLKTEGFQVEAMQIDAGAVPLEEKVVPIGRGSLADLKSHGGSAVPYLLIADLKRKALLPGVQGYHEYEEVIDLLRVASKT